MTITTKEWYDGDGRLNLIIEWDEEDPYECQLNDWTPDDFLTAIRDACDQTLSMGDTIQSYDCK